MLAERLQRARKGAGLSQREAASRAGLSHTAVSKWEKGELKPSSAHLIRLAKLYGVRTEYFFRPRTVTLDNVEYRKRAKVSKALLNRVHTDVLDQAERWHELLDLFPRKPIPDFTVPSELPDRIDAPEGIEELAVQLRSCWRLGLTPIPDLIDTLESLGILVIVTASTTGAEVDGMAGSAAGTPFVVVSNQTPGDRQRLTLAHELAHLVLANRLTPALLQSIAPGKDSKKAEELACHRLAGAFLLPAPAVREHLGEHRRKLEMQELHLLKHEYGLSMQAVLYRALQADVISSRVHTSLFRAISKRGWRTQEPGKAYPSEHTVLFEQLVYRALAEEYIGESKAAELLGMSVIRFHRQRTLEGSDAGPH